MFKNEFRRVNDLRQRPEKPMACALQIAKQADYSPKQGPNHAYQTAKKPYSPLITGLKPTRVEHPGLLRFKLEIQGLHNAIVFFLKPLTHHRLQVLTKESSGTAPKQPVFVNLPTTLPSV